MHEAVQILPLLAYATSLSQAPPELGAIELHAIASVFRLRDASLQPPGPVAREGLARNATARAGRCNTPRSIHTLGGDAIRAVRRWILRRWLR